MEKILEILNDIDDDIDYENCTTLIDDKILTSLSILTLVSDLEDEFDIEFSPADLVPGNFNSLALIKDLIDRKLAD